jgi:hypothetical protein
MQDLVGLGRAGAGFNVALGPVQVQVRPQDVDAALELLEAHDLGFTGPDELPEEGEDV